MDNQIDQLKSEIHNTTEREPSKVRPQILKPSVSPAKKLPEATTPKVVSNDDSGTDSTQSSPSVIEDKGKRIGFRPWFCIDHLASYLSMLYKYLLENHPSIQMLCLFFSQTPNQTPLYPSLPQCLVAFLLHWTRYQREVKVPDLQEGRMTVQ